MTKQQAKELVEATGAVVLSVRIRHGMPLVTIGWRDYLKVIGIPELYRTFDISQRS